MAAEAIRSRPPAAHADFRRDLVEGLGRRQKSIPCTYFYDPAGAELFTRICRQPEYYPTRTEIALLADHAGDLARHLPKGAALVEFGAGSSEKADLLLAALDRPAAYVPIDVSASCLAATERRLRRRFPGLPVMPIAADFTRPLSLGLPPHAPRIGFFPGSTIGNFDPPDAGRLLARFAAALGPGCRLVVGVDRKKDVRVLNAAYNDAAGVTAAFNLNLLVRANRELGADFDVAGFVHRAFYNRALGRIEMHLISVRRQKVHIADRIIRFGAGETIHTENSYKYDDAGFAACAAAAGLAVRHTWSDAAGLFAVHLLAAAPAEATRPT